MPLPQDRAPDDPRRTTPGTPRPGAGAGPLRQPPAHRPVQPAVPEIGGPKGPEPTRYGDWEKGGRCTDF
jgi:hypothetical protein